MQLRFFLRGIKLVHTRAVLCFFFEEVCFTKNTEIDFARLNRYVKSLKTLFKMANKCVISVFEKTLEKIPSEPP